MPITFKNADCSAGKLFKRLIVVISIFKVKKAGSLFTLTLGVLSLALIFSAPSCGGSKSKDPEVPAKIAMPPEKISSVTLLPVQIPDGHGTYYSFGAANFVNGYYDQDILALKVSESVSVVGEEMTAASSSIFLSSAGFLWKIEPSSPVTISLTARGKTQTITRNSNQDSNIVAISLLSFPEVFPPVFRERYELTIASYPGVPSPFSYTYSFNVRRSDAETIYADILPGDSSSAIRLGFDTANYNIAKIAPSLQCPQCTIEVENLSLNANVKYFVELPSIPSSGDFRITFPRRFSGLLVKTTVSPLAPSIIGNNTSAVSISMAIPGSITTVIPWCSRKTMVPGSCTVLRSGIAVPSYFKFLNAVPFDVASESLGGTNGIASISIAGEATVTIRRDGFVMEKKKISLGSGENSPLNSPLLPNWALDDIRNALFSGAPEFKL